MTDNGATPDSAMALTSVNTLINLDVSEEDQATLRDVAEALGNDAVGDISEKMADIAHSVAVDIEVVARQLIMEAIFGKKSAIKPDPERALARLRQLKAQTRSKMMNITNGLSLETRTEVIREALSQDPQFFRIVEELRNRLPQKHHPTS